MARRNFNDLKEKALERPGARERIENETDLYISTLRSYVEAIGGKLELRVEFPDAGSIVVNLADFDRERGTAQPGRTGSVPLKRRTHPDPNPVAVLR